MGGEGRDAGRREELRSRQNQFTWGQRARVPGSRHRERRGWLRLGAGFPTGDQTSEAQSQAG